MRIARVILLVAVVFGSGQAWAAKHDHQPIMDLEGIVAMGQLESMGTSDPSAIRAIGRQYKDKLDAAIVKASAAAKGNADLLKAVKEYYVAATSYFDSIGHVDAMQEALSKRAESILSEKENALELELKLAK